MFQKDVFIIVQLICIGFILIYAQYFVGFRYGYNLGPFLQTSGLITIILAMLLYFFNRTSRMIESIPNKIVEMKATGIASINSLSLGFADEIAKSLFNFNETKMAISSPRHLKLIRLLLERLSEISKKFDQKIKLQLLLSTEIDIAQIKIENGTEYEYGYEHEHGYIIQMAKRLSMEKKVDISLKTSSKRFINGFVITPAYVSVILALEPKKQSGLVIVSEPGSDLERDYRMLFDSLWEDGRDITNDIQR